MRRPRMIVGISACLLAVASAVVASPASARPVPAPGSGRLEVYTGQVQGDDLAAIFELGVDRHDVQVTADPATPGTLDVEVILGPQQVEQLARQGIVLDAQDHRRGDPVRPGDSRGSAGPHGVPALRRTGWAQGRVRTAGREQRRAGGAPGHRPDAQRRGHRRHEGHEGSRRDGGRQQARGCLHRRAARPGVDHARDGAPPAAPRARRLRQGPGDHRAPRHDRAVVRARLQP